MVTMSMRFVILQQFQEQRSKLFAFNLQIDTQKPVLTSGYTTKKDGVETFYARKTKDVGNGGILREQVFYVKTFDEEGTLVKEGKTP